MDTVVERKPGAKRKHYYAIAGAVALVEPIFCFIFRDTSPSMSVERNRLTIITIIRGEFGDYIRVIGQVMPDHTIYMDVVEGGRVEERLREGGAIVKASDIILRFSSPLLNIGIMQGEADLAYQEDELCNTCISMEQGRLRLKQKRTGLSKELAVKQRRYDQHGCLIKEQLVAQEDSRLTREEHETVQAQLNVVNKHICWNNTFREGQIHSLGGNTCSMRRSLALVRERMGNLKVEAPIDRYYLLYMPPSPRDSWNT